MEFLNENINSGEYDMIVPGTHETSHLREEPEEIPDTCTVPQRKISRKTKECRLDRVVDVESEKLLCLKRLVEIEEEKLQLKKEVFQFKKMKWEAKVAQMNLQTMLE
ncbi:uncharacterized protein LOC106180021 [Lingula anatina]|uniref:Uncharacterized protein LOC106180021 n=1 Tax=Lingula anatina TaxID=7574 RepID=A0A1S3KAQ2_LINAN|nr:uncharacterized protein LOC106180021 [Lingula anatina]|eukprot:XP_013419336.1 uncharacterized protein LOC106180021 [Lingula anatina]